MMLTAVVLPVLFLFAAHASVPKRDCVLPNKPRNQTEYYWRDYNGVIPKDALPGGFDENRNITYISQVPSPIYPGLFPGIIYPGRRDTVTCARERVVVAVNVKIMCANRQEKFKWVSTTADTSHLLTDYKWVVGGSAFSWPFYLGRATFQGEVQIGRVFQSTSVYKGLWLCHRNGNQVNFQSFELLVMAK